MNRRIKSTGDFCQAVIEVELSSKFLSQKKNSNMKIFAFQIRVRSWISFNLWNRTCQTLFWLFFLIKMTHFVISESLLWLLKAASQPDMKESFPPELPSPGRTSSLWRPHSSTGDPSEFGNVTAGDAALSSFTSLGQGRAQSKTKPQTISPVQKEATGRQFRHLSESQYFCMDHEKSILCFL